MTETPPLDIAAIETLKGLMKDNFAHLIETFFNTTTQQYDDLKTAIDDNNADQIVTILHILKGSSGSVGAMSIHDKSQAFETKARAGDIENSDEWMKQLSAELESFRNEIQNHL